MKKTYKKVDYKLEYRLFCEAQAQKQLWYSQYSNIYRLVLPNRNAFNVSYDYDNAARYENLQMYDSTAMTCAYIRANDLHGLLMPKDRKWARFTANPNKLKQDLTWQAKEYIDTANNIIFGAIEASNLAMEVPNVLLDLVGGMGCIKIESPSDNMPLKFTSIPAYVTYVAMGQTDTIERVWVKDQMPKWKVIQTYPDAEKNMSIAQADDLQLIDVYVGQCKLDNGSYWNYAFVTDFPEEPFWEKESYFKAIHVVRDRVHPGESEGRGVAMDMIWQIRDLNIVWKQHLRSMTVKSDPPIWYDSKMPFSPNSLRSGLAGAMIPSMNGQPPMAYLQPPMSPEVSATVEDLRNQIRAAFMVDPLGSIDQPVHSATEISIRENRAQRTSTTDVSRVINELPRPIFEAATLILVHRGIVHFGMKELNDNGNLLFEFHSPLQDVQAAQDLQNVAQAFQFIQQYFGEGAVLTATDPNAVKDFVIDNLRLNHALFRSPEEIQAQMKAMAEQQAAQTAPPQSTTSAQSQPDMPAQPAGTAA